MAATCWNRWRRPVCSMSMARRRVRSALGRVTRQVLLPVALLCHAGCAETPEELVARLGSRDPRELKEVSERLLQHDDDVVPALRQGLTAPKWRARFMSAQLLGTLRARPALADLIAALSDSNAGVVERSATALGQIGDDMAVPGLVLALDHPSIDVALAAAASLEQIESPRAMPGLLAHLDGPSPRLRLRAMRALGTCTDTTQAIADSIYGRLKGALASPSPSQQVAAIAGLRGFAYRGLAPWLLAATAQAPDEVIYVAVQALGEIVGARHPAWWGATVADDAQITSTLMDVARHALREEIRVKAIGALGARQLTEVVPLLDSLKTSPDREIRIAAGRALRTIAGESW